jgi:hypothetical protein
MGFTEALFLAYCGWSFDVEGIKQSGTDALTATIQKLFSSQPSAVGALWCDQYVSCCWWHVWRLDRLEQLLSAAASQGWEQAFGVVRPGENRTVSQFTGLPRPKPLG